MIWDDTLWNWSSPVWLIAIAILGGYLAVFRSLNIQRACILALGLITLIFAFVSPVGVLADGYLFSAHMIQHLLLLLAIPMCLLLSLPKEKLTDWFSRPIPQRYGTMISAPILGWICGVGAMWFWHVPTFCTAATMNPALGVLRDLSFVLAGLLFWWPIYSPVEEFRLQPLNGIAYLFSACLGCTLLGIYITFTTISVCPAFANPVDRIGILNLLYNAGLTPNVDQHLGGLLMWVPPCSLYVCVNIDLLRRWYSLTQPALDSNQVGTHINALAK
ncbi:cytochrome c oxidase assembly protein [Calycomorphotria hydatis]|uniref:Cytochrome c oxidase caa3 assembly factor (Caa3_CtaG) n=1 Tax=Calycomorphotria hydatis TaxID=2528027 RepID=A0A517T984_9PLAN|nr:cytochrome c oxidase assembly protein [Calycomorphotria hydatis]QDT64945.1 Cytochrome c oxidase caa3 assembly factor (Caa3_CtaG) [Calycomorphotria hydatis]